LAFREALMVAAINLLVLGFFRKAGSDTYLIPDAFRMLGGGASDRITLMLVAGLLLILAGIFVKRRPDVNTRRVMGAILGGQVGSLFGLTVFLAIIVFASWTADYLREGEFYMAAASILMVLTNVLLFAILLRMPASSSSSTRQPYKKRILIMPLSIPNPDCCKASEDNQSPRKEEKSPCREKCKCEEECGKKILSSINRILLNPSQPHERCNWRVPLMSVEHHAKTLERIYVITSRESSKCFHIFREGVRGYLNKVKIEEIGPVDFNDYDEVLNRLLATLKVIRRDGYGDEDLTFNISGGTSAVTAALTVAAVREGHQAEYVEQKRKDPQDPPKLLRIDVRPGDVWRAMGFSPES